MTVFDELKARGLLAQLTDEEEIKELINNGKACLLYTSTVFCLTVHGCGRNILTCSLKISSTTQ